MYARGPISSALIDATDRFTDTARVVDEGLTIMPTRDGLKKVQKTLDTIGQTDELARTRAADVIAELR